MWSDGCGYQNHNACVANAYSELARKYGVLITQKYLVAGQTQMECVSMHSAIECKRVADIFNPRCHYTPKCKNQAFTLTRERAHA